MALAAGARLGPYEILDVLGAGGMGEVYRARDTRLDRDVAIKIVLEQFVADGERLARFRREAKTLASLNHPNIGGIYGLEDTSGITALVLEFVDGPTLADRIGEGPIPVDEALPLARQIVEALEAAHEQGIIHRDLKPANIKVRPDGAVKVLDFGLAKAMDSHGAGGPGGPGQNMSMSPTITTPAVTLAGVILGTAAYMSPEQAKGRNADKRSDVWAFGCVLYEMLTAKRAFDGEDVSDTLALILRGTPDWDALPQDTPARIVKLIRGCLQRDRKERVPDIAVARFEIKEALAAPPDTSVPTAPAPPPAVSQPVWKRAAPVALAAVVAGAIVGAAAWTLKPAPAEPHPVTRFTINLGEGQEFTTRNSSSMAFSPDGSRLVYVANSQLYVRSMSEPDARPIPGTLAQPGPVSPVFSPDGESVAFFSFADRTIKKISINGGAAVTVCPAIPTVLGMSWDAGAILFGQATGLMRVSENGGQPELLVKAVDGERLQGPRLLPGGEWMLFSSTTATGLDAWDKARVVAQSLRTGERKTLLTGGSDARYVPSGHIVYALSGVMFAVPFDTRRMAVTGEPVPVIEGVRRQTGPINSTAHVAVSNTGTVAYVPGPPSAASNQMDVVMMDRTGTATPLKLPPGPYEHPRVSPDGKRIAFGSDDGQQAAIWIYDLSGASSMRRLTLGGHNRLAVWADNERVVFQSDREGDAALWWQQADGNAPAERLTKPDKDTAHLPESTSPDGRTLLLSVLAGSTYSLGAWSMAERKLTAPFAGVTSTVPVSAAFSPDGKWFAYTLAPAGDPASAVLVQPFPPTGSVIPITKTGGIHPSWSPDGTELFWWRLGQFTGATVTTKPSFTFSNPIPLPIVLAEAGGDYERSLDVMPDGKRLLGVMSASQSAATPGAVATPHIEVVLNWFEELRAKVPGGKK